MNWKTGLKLIMNASMNSSSFLMILIFLAIGYVAHPVVLPLVEDKLPKAKVNTEVGVEKTTPKAVTPPVVVENVVAAPAEPDAQEVIEEPVVDEVIEVTAPETSKQMSDADVVAVMQKSVKAGEVTEFSYDDVQAWEFSGEEDIEGSSYAVGEVTVTVTTILGVGERKVKALCRNGVVVKWIWAASGVEIE